MYYLNKYQAANWRVGKGMEPLLAPGKELSRVGTSISKRQMLALVLIVAFLLTFAFFVSYELAPHFFHTLMFGSSDVLSHYH